MKHRDHAPLLERILRRTPMLGYVIRLLETERYKELALFGANVLASGILLVGAFGYPAVITIAYLALAASLMLLAALL
jgi:hypothetical protein